MTTTFHIEKFLYTFFKANECEVYEYSEGLIDVQLTEKLDRAIMNRPFYWHYVKQTGRRGEPFRLKLVTNMNKRVKNGEWIHIGTPRMNDICRYLEENCLFIQQFEQLVAGTETMLQPWLIVNVIITFKGKHTRQLIKSIGLNLINGLFIENAMEKLKVVNLSSFIADHCYTISPIITLQSGYQRIENKLIDEMVSLDFSWVEESVKQLKDELLLLYHFYDEKSSNRDDMINEALQIIERLSPEITFEVINGGLFYLSNQWNKKI